MENFGFIRVAAAIPELKVADCSFNREKMERLIQKAIEQEVQIVCFPELSVTGYTCGDLFFQQLLLEQAESEIACLIETFANSNIIFIVGAPVSVNGKLFNSALVCQAGKILGIVPKTYLPNHNEFSEKRWFVSAKDCKETTIKYSGQEVPFGANILFGDTSAVFAVEICEDLWVTSPPSSEHAVNGAQIIFNLSANNELAGKNDYWKSLIQQQSARCIAGYVYASAGYGESTTDVVFTGNGFIYENGYLLSSSKRFTFEEQLIISEIDVDRLRSDRQKNALFVPETANSYRKVNVEFSPIIYQSTLTRVIIPKPFLLAETVYKGRCEEIFSIQIGGLAKRLLHTKVNTAVIGVSGGLDSTLALLVTVKTFDKLKMPRKNIIGITMPGFGTTGRTYNNALSLMQSLGITIREISIVVACKQHFEDIGHDISVHDATFENTQARERTQILMDIANQTNGLVVGTGNLSELALGWATYNGDHISMYGVNSGVPKTLVRHLVKWAAETQVDEQSAAILLDIIDTPVSPELLPADSNGDISQKTEDIVGPYELHDFFLYYAVRFGFSPRKILFLAQNAFKDSYTDEIILKWMEVFFRRFFSQQFKRSCMPDGPKIGSVNLSPRGNWKMPSDASSALWLKEIENINP
ncbi:MAG: NAD(+) synthase [Dysgonamonadaceae bacterium]|jgi:NAD+ synthase (glutamine-hydrolysing)|nr:NAD(+) synthase [Dysgonamonadaceae bacterium]